MREARASVQQPFQQQQYALPNIPPAGPSTSAVLPNGPSNIPPGGPSTSTVLPNGPPTDLPGGPSTLSVLTNGPPTDLLGGLPTVLPAVPPTFTSKNDEEEREYDEEEDVPPNFTSKNDEEESEYDKEADDKDEGSSEGGVPCAALSDDHFVPDMNGVIVRAPPTNNLMMSNPTILDEGSRVLVVYKGALYKATIHRHCEKSGKSEYLIHYDGNKKSTVTWIPVDHIKMDNLVKPSSEDNLFEPSSNDESTNVNPSLFAYRILREGNIQRNKGRLKALGLLPKQTSPKKTKKKKKRVQPPMERRVQPKRYVKMRESALESVVDEVKQVE